MSVDWRFVGEELTKDRTMRDARLFKPKSVVGYQILAQRLETDGKIKLMAIALDEALHIERAKGARQRLNESRHTPGESHEN